MIRAIDPPAPAMATPRQSRAFLVGLGLVLAAIGALFCFWLGRAYLRIKAVDTWPETRCMLLKAEIVEFQPVPNVAPRYRLDVDYFYTFNDRTYHSDKVRGRVRTTTDRAKAEAWQSAHEAGSEATCFVNPVDPAIAILEKDSKAVGYTIWFPALFVIGGIGMAVQALRKHPRSRRA